MKSKKLLFQESLGLTESKNEKKQDSHLNNILRELNFNNPKLKKIESQLAGIFQSSLCGSGFDFNEIREYKIGDDLRHISWSTTAKTGNLHTKEFFAEKEVRIYFLVDISNSMFFGNKLEAFIKLFAFLLKTCQLYSEKIGGIFFTDDIKYHFSPLESKSQSQIMFQTLFNFSHKLNLTYEKSTFTNLGKAASFTSQFFLKKGFVFIISDLINTNDWEKQFYELSQKQNIYLFQIHDPIDFNLEKVGYISLLDPETNKRFVVNTDSKDILEVYKKAMEESQNKINSFFTSIGIKHITVEKSDFV